MISILAPSKTLDFEHDAPSWVMPSTPRFFADAQKVATTLAELDVEKLREVMGVSTTIASINYERLQQWGSTTKPALWAYRGDVYKGMYADTLTKRDVDWAEGHMRIMSGMYGALRPLDAISPYRLEMKAKLPILNTATMYEFWGKQLAEFIDQESNGTVCVLSSQEYALPVTKYSRSRLVTPVFMDHKPNGTIGSVPIYSKMMRGVMARWIIDTRTDSPEQLVHFSGFGYTYDSKRSTADGPVFVRKKMTPLIF